MYYRARYYHPALGRFVQADTIVPDPANPQSLNRYAYVLNNPLRYVDPTGHMPRAEIMKYLGFSTWEETQEYFSDAPSVLKMLEHTGVEIGSIVVASDPKYTELQAMLVLVGNAESDEFTLSLWDLKEGVPINWSKLEYYTQFGVWTDRGSGFEWVYGNEIYSRSDQGLSPPALHIEDVHVPVPRGYQFGHWLDLNEQQIVKTAAIFTISVLAGILTQPGIGLTILVLRSLGIASVDLTHAALNNNLVDKKYPYIQAPYRGVNGTIYDEYGIPHSASPLTVSFTGPLGPLDP
jgi:hypothetical protein